MFYLGIDQHARQITISLRDENGDVIQARQVSTQSEKISAPLQRMDSCLWRGDTSIYLMQESLESRQSYELV